MYYFLCLEDIPHAWAPLPVTYTLWAGRGWAFYWISLSKPLSHTTSADPSVAVDANVYVIHLDDIDMHLQARCPLHVPGDISHARSLQKDHMALDRADGLLPRRVHTLLHDPVLPCFGCLGSGAV